MKHFSVSLLTFLSCFFTSLYSQEQPNLIAPTKVTTIGYWNNGQSTLYHVKETNRTFKGKSDKPHKSASSEYDLELTVVDSTEDHYLFEMKYTNYIPDAKASKLVTKLAALQNELPIRYQTNELGQFDTIVNLPELQQQLIEKLEYCIALIDEEKEEEEVKEIYKMVVLNMVKQFQEMESVEALFLGDILAIHGFYGFQMQVGKPIDIELGYPTIGDMVLTGTGKLTLNTINKTKDECVFSTTEKPNRDELGEYLYSLALLFMMDSGKKISLEELSLNMNTRKKIKMELSSGWMNSVEITNTVKLTNKKGNQKKMTSLVYQRN